MVAGLAKRPATHEKKRGLLSIRHANNATGEIFYYLMKVRQITLFVRLPQAYGDGKVAPLQQGWNAAIFSIKNRISIYV